MEKNKFVWMIKNLYSDQPTKCQSDPFLIAGCFWRLHASSKGNNLEFFYMYLGAVDSQSLPSRWRRHVQLRLKIVNRLLENHSIVTDSELYLDDKSSNCSYPTVLPPSKVLEEDSGFLVKGELMIVVEELAHEVIGTLGELEDCKLLRRIEESHGVKKLNKTQEMKECVDIDGFQVLPSQVESVKRIFERYPDIALEVLRKKPYLRTTYMNVFLGVIETLCQLPEDISDDDLEEASAAVSYAIKGGFKVDWLETKLKEVKEKKNKFKTGKARLRPIEEELQKLNQKCLELKALLEKEKAEVSAVNVAFSFNDVV